MNPFEWSEPTSLAEALSILDTEGPGVRPVSGGTALMLMMKAGVFSPSRLVSLEKIEAKYSDIALGDDGLEIGAMASLSSLQRPHIGAAYPVIARTLLRLSNVRVRNIARVGGALAHGDPHMDLPPLLAALGARATMRAPDGTRTLAVEDLYTGYYETVLAPNELITSVSVPPMQGRLAAYLKITARSADDWPALGIAVSFKLVGDTLADIRLVVSAATATVARLRGTEVVLEGAPTDTVTLRRAGEIAATEAQVLSDSRGSAGYKRELLRVCVGRAVRQALADAPRQDVA